MKTMMAFTLALLLCCSILAACGARGSKAEQHLPSESTAWETTPGMTQAPADRGSEAEPLPGKESGETAIPEETALESLETEAEGGPYDMGIF